MYIFNSIILNNPYNVAFGLLQGSYADKLTIAPGQNIPNSADTLVLTSLPSEISTISDSYSFVCEFDNIPDNIHTICVFFGILFDVNIEFNVGQIRINDYIYDGQILYMNQHSPESTPSGFVIYINN